MSDQIYVNAARRCACANIRRTDRIITQFYDEILAPSGLSISQFGLLATLFTVAPTTINRLAEIMSMDRTTLTRNLGLLTKQQLVQGQEGKDRRVHLVLLTDAGKQAFMCALPLWQEAQSRIERVFGLERFNALIVELTAFRALVK